MTSVADEKTLDALYGEFAAAGLAPLWVQSDDLMPTQPQPQARPHVWRWANLHRLAARAGELVPVGQGGERRAIALANPGLPGRPYATPTLWAAIQYLGPHEVATSHRHTQGAFRFVVDGEGVWTNVDGDPVAMRRGDLLLTSSWRWHEHHNTTGQPMAWLDGLDIPLVAELDAGFFELGPAELTTAATPAHSRSERLWAHPGLRPVGTPDQPNSPLAAYRWVHTDAALGAQLELQAEGYPAGGRPGHAAVRFTNPTTGQDALATLRMEMHRLAAGVLLPPRRTVGSSVWQVFTGSATFHLDGEAVSVDTGDLVAVPSWCALSVEARGPADLFRFSDGPVYERLQLARADAGEQW